MIKEYILCAAIIDKNKLDAAGHTLIYCGHRHNNILWQSKDVPRDPYAQGFLTNKGRFVDRKEALRIALEAKQIEAPQYNDNQLFSEDLY